MSKTRDSKPAVYFNLKYNESGSPVIDHSESPDLPTARVHPYVNLPLSEKPASHSPSPQNHSPEKTSPGKVPSPTKSTTSGEEAGQGGTGNSPLRRHLSETGFRLSGKDGDHNKLKSNGLSPSTPSSSASAIPAKQAMANAKFDLLTQQAGGGTAKGKGCDKCDELMDLLASWQIGAGSLMRNYSRILSLLTQTRDSALALECRLGEQQSLTDARPSSAPPNGKQQQFAQVTGSAIISGSLRPQPAVTIRDDGGLSHSSKGTSAVTVSRGAAAVGASSPQHVKKAGKNRQSMFVSSSGAAHTTANVGDLGENMYPKREELVSHQVYSPTVPTVVNPATYAKDMEELKKNLWDAIDLCQQLAAACFKKTHLTTPSGSESKDKSTLQSQHSALPVPLVPLSSSTPSSDFLRKHSEGSLPQVPQFKSTLHTIRESKAAGERERKRKKREGMERVTSAPSLECSSEGMTSSGEKEGLSAADDEGYVHVTAKGIPDSVTKAADVKSSNKTPPMQNGVNNPETTPSEAVNDYEPSANNRTRMRKTSLEDTESESASDCGMSPLSGDDKGEEAETESIKGAEMEGNERSASMFSGVSTYTDSDVKYVMSKIASLEEERYRLLETIDKLHNENSSVRLSLHEILSDLDNKDLQLTLAMQDLSIATEEIRKAAEMRRKLKSLSGERDALLERLEALEDESSAVKVSLIQLLQEKSATNKTLVLENWRLTQKAQSQAQRPGKNSSSDLTVPVSPSSLAPAPAPAPASGGDNISIRSGYSATTDDSAIQEAVMGADMIENFVHKQGFLVKQGGRVKNWRKRLFVLNTDGLSYYKTEQPIQTVPISKIEKVQLCHGRCPQPHMFEVHTRNRVFYLSASSADEMQSWVGMLETLKQYRRTATMHAKLMSKAKVPSASIPPVQEVVTSGDSSQPPHSATSEEDEGMATAITTSSSGAAAAGKTLASSYEDGESDEEEHVTLHQQPTKGVSHGDIDDEDNSLSTLTYPIELRTEYALSAPEESSMMKSRTSMSGKVLEGLDLSNL